MSLLVLGLSHHTAPLAVIEELSGSVGCADAIASSVLASAAASEVVVLSTCNRLEVYAEVSGFHPGVAAVGEALAQAAGQSARDLTDHLYVRYDDSAVAHAFRVACGLDSMAVGETQILAQMRDALAVAQAHGRVGHSLNSLLQQALRVGKRAHAETGIDRAGASLVDAALRRAERELGPVGDLRVLVVGAGSMSALAATTIHRAAVASLTVANRTTEHAERLAGAVGGSAVALGELPEALERADLVISCTGAVGYVIDAAMVGAASRPPRQLYVDLALPRDLDPTIAQLPGVVLADLESLGADLAGEQFSDDLEQVRALVDQEVSDYLVGRRVQALAPTVAALRARAAEVVTAELSRLSQRLPAVDEVVRTEVQRTVHRVVEKLLYAPTVRVKELVSRTDGGSYEVALRELFDLDPKGVAAVSDVSASAATVPAELRQESR